MKNTRRKLEKMGATSKKQGRLRSSNLNQIYSLTRYFYFLTGIILFFATPQLSIAQAFRDCKNAGGKYLDCRPPDVSPWEDFRILRAPGMPYGVCGGPFSTEQAAVDCAKPYVDAAYPLGTTWGTLCTKNWYVPSDSWKTYNATYYGWVLSEVHDSLRFDYTAHINGQSNCSPPATDRISIVRTRRVTCPATYPRWLFGPDSNLGLCSRDAPQTESTQCVRPVIANPVMVTDRSKMMRAVDYAASSSSLLRFERLYLSIRPLAGGSATSGWGARWKTNYDRTISINTAVSPTVAFRTDENENIAAFIKQDASWIASAGGVGALRELLNFTGQRTGWRYISRTEVEEFDVNGRLVALGSADGKLLTLSYLPNGDLAAVTDQFGRSLNFSVKVDSVDGRKYAATMVDPSGSLTRYFFDDANATGPIIRDIKAFDLTKVVFPDGQAKAYRYSEPHQFVPPSNTALPPIYSLLTGVIDESGQRYSSYTYDQYARVITSELVGGINRYTFGSDTYQEKVGVTDPLGTVRTYSISGQRVRQVEQPAGAGSGPCAQSNVFDVNSGLVNERSDFNGVRTCYAYDLSRNVETQRLEGLTGGASCSAAIGSPPAETRLVTTQWHPDWRLETRRAEPRLITTWVYNGQGASCAPANALVDGKPIAVVCRRTEQATADDTGAAGFAASVSGPARTSTFTYNRWGQVLTSNGPRGDASDTLTHEYYADTQSNWTMGDLRQTTNAAGHVTRFTRYNRHGQVLERVEPNGLVTQYTYDLRQRLTRVQVGDEVSTYEYDAVGNLTKVSLPEGGNLTYTYDPAHRLVAIQDAQGNRIDYTLDAMGNRIGEKTTDAAGVLRRNLTRTIDALNRVQRVVGGE